MQAMAQKDWTFTSTSEDETARLGRALAEALPEGGVVALCGTLGAGKTRLVQAVAEASGVDRRDVVSPTFVLVHEYHGRQTIYHLDAYRVRDRDEFRELGAEEYFASGALVLVEWADRVAECLPEEHLRVTLEVAAPESRRVTFSPRGAGYEAAVAKLRAAV